MELTSVTDTPAQVLYTDSADLLRPGIELLLKAGVAVKVLPDGITADQAAAEASSAPVAVVGVLRFGRRQIDQLASTRLVIRAGVGVDVIDLAAAFERGIQVANVPDFCTEEVADHTILLLQAATRRLSELSALPGKMQRWIVTDVLPPVHRTAGRSLGIVGMGRIGTGVATRARAFGWDVIAYDPKVDEATFEANGVRPVGLDELFTTAHAITLHCPLTEATRSLVDAARLATVCCGVVVINTSRGGLVDLDALDRAIDDGRVGAAALDVLEDEPAPDLGRPLLHRANVIVTPHVAWYSLEARRDLAVFTAEEALRYLRGEPLRNSVGPDAVSSR